MLERSVTLYPIVIYQMPKGEHYDEEDCRPSWDGIGPEIIGGRPVRAESSGCKKQILTIRSKLIHLVEQGLMRLVILYRLLL